jgi:hypothetical protein
MCKYLVCRLYTYIGNKPGAKYNFVLLPQVYCIIIIIIIKKK